MFLLVVLLGFLALWYAEIFAHHMEKSLTSDGGVGGGGGTNIYAKRKKELNKLVKLALGRCCWRC